MPKWVAICVSSILSGYRIEPRAKLFLIQGRVELGSGFQSTVGFAISIAHILTQSSFRLAPYTTFVTDRFQQVFLNSWSWNSQYRLIMHLYHDVMLIACLIIDGLVLSPNMFQCLLMASQFLFMILLLGWISGSKLVVEDISRLVPFRGFRLSICPSRQISRKHPLHPKRMCSQSPR